MHVLDFCCQELKRLKEMDSERPDTIGPMEPLLHKLSEEFIDDEDLGERLRKLFKVHGDEHSCRGKAN